MTTRRQFLLGAGAGAGLLLSGCSGGGDARRDGAPSDGPAPNPDALPPLPSTATWMYFKGNGHETGRNGAYDRINVQRYFSVPTLEGAVDTLPWAAGFSVCWQLIPVRQAGYYTTFFYAASKNTDFYDLRDGSGYAGAHPYPYAAFGNGGGDDFRLHKWEISIDGGDFVTEDVAYGQAHTQAFRVAAASGGRSQTTFFTRIAEGVAPAAQPKVTHTHEGSYLGAAPHPFKAMVFGNAPWWAAHQHERLSGFVRRIKVFAGELTDEELLAESLSDPLATAAGGRRLWWGKISPQNPDDLASDFLSSDGRRRVAAWADAARCEIVAHADLPSHHAFLSATTIGDLQHMERG
ncbi:MAG: hypothetical protein R3B48_04600 [Kofleriaceae bacterium]